MTTNRDVLVKAAADAVAARLAIDAAARRRSAATAAAQNLIDLATATERAERDAAWSALGASVHILVAEQVAIADIAELCGMSADFIRELSDAGPGDAPAARDRAPRLPCSAAPRGGRPGCGHRSPVSCGRAAGFRYGPVRQAGRRPGRSG